MIILSVDNQAWIFLFSLVLGAFLGIIYSIIKIMRLIVPHSTFMKATEDILYWFGSAFFIFLFMLKKNSGEIRLFSIFGIFSAFIIYNFTLGKVVMAISQNIINVLKKVFGVFLEIIMTPFRIIWYLIKLPTVKIYKKIKKNINKVLQLFEFCVKIVTITIYKFFTGNLSRESKAVKEWQKRR